jgi:phage I-like protein
MLFALSENTDELTQVAKVGRFKHPVYGEFDISENDLDRMIFHLSTNARRQKLKFDGVEMPVLPIDYFHEEEKIAAGWIKGLQKKLDSRGVKALFADVVWTPKGKQKIEDRELAFTSPLIARNYKDSETGKTYDVILKGAALTNIPFLRDMEPAQALSEARRLFMLYKLSGDNPDINSNQGENMPKWKKILEGLDSVSPEDRKELSEAIEEESKKLSEKVKADAKKLKKTQDGLKLSEEKVKDLEEKAADSEKGENEQLTLALSEAKEAKKQVASLTKTMAETAKKAGFDKMLSEGKVCEAQRKAYMKDDMVEFAKNQEAVKLDESGANAKGDDSEAQAHAKLQKLAEAKQEKDKSLSYGEAVSLALSENPDLEKKLGYTE